MSTNNSSATSVINPQAALLDTFFPGFSLVSSVILKYLKIDVTSYIPFVLAIGILTFLSQYSTDYLRSQLEAYFMSEADIRVDDEIYNMVMNWVANQKFAKQSRRFVSSVSLTSRWLRSYDDEWSDEDDNDYSERRGNAKSKPLQYTPSFGTHFFWYKRHLLLFKRQENQKQAFSTASEREEISIACFGRNPAILKELLNECRSEFLKNDENKTVIYRGNASAMSSDSSWTRCMSRNIRPFSTVVLDEDIKQELVDDLRDYLNPLTRRYYTNRGIPYRRGYLLYGPPGTGKSSLSFAIAGYFKLKIYIVSLNSPTMTEENLSSLFDELPKKCVVLLEDIDTAGLTHTRESSAETVVPVRANAAGPGTPGAVPGAPAVVASTNAPRGRISLSALLNVIDGVASQEGRVLIMTTNHINQLDEALIRPGRIDMMVKFDYSSTAMIASLFRGIFTTLEGDFPEVVKPQDEIYIKSKSRKAKLGKDAHGTDSGYNSEREAATAEIDQTEAAKSEADRIAALADEFAAALPSNTFSPAEIQGYLLRHKRAPEKAISGAAQWVEATKTKRKLEVEKKAKEAAEAAAAEQKAKEEEAAKKAREEREAADKAAKTEKGEAKPVEMANANGAPTEAAPAGV